MVDIERSKLDYYYITHGYKLLLSFSIKYLLELEHIYEYIKMSMPTLIV